MDLTRFLKMDGGEETPKEERMEHKKRIVFIPASDYRPGGIWVEYAEDCVVQACVKLLKEEGTGFFKLNPATTDG